MYRFSRCFVCLVRTRHNKQQMNSCKFKCLFVIVYRYAVAKSLINKQRVIYTTPIKALSNQKYREFLEEFKDVGLVTGDVTINPSASCLIMTTEVCTSFRENTANSGRLKSYLWVLRLLPFPYFLGQCFSNVSSCVSSKLDVQVSRKK